MLLNAGVGKVLRVPWTARRSTESILKEISPGCSLEGLMLKLKPQYFGHLMWRANSLEKSLMLGKIEDRRRRGQQRMRWLGGITDSMDMGLGTLEVDDGQGGLACCGSWGCKESDMSEWLNWIELVRNLGNNLDLRLTFEVVAEGGRIVGLSPQPVQSDAITYLWAESIRTELNCRALNWCQYITYCCWKPHPSCWPSLLELTSVFTMH